jgi:hypothetical protein
MTLSNFGARFRLSDLPLADVHLPNETELNLRISATFAMVLGVQSILELTIDHRARDRI